MFRATLADKLRDPLKNVIVNSIGVLLAPFDWAEYDLAHGRPASGRVESPVSVLAHRRPCLSASASADSSCALLTPPQRRPYFKRNSASQRPHRRGGDRLCPRIALERLQSRDHARPILRRRRRYDLRRLKSTHPPLFAGYFTSAIRRQSPHIRPPPIHTT